MPIHAITAVGEPGHITAADDGLTHAALVGTGTYIMTGIGSECAMSTIDANTIRIADGLMCVQGRWVNFVNATDVTLDSGTLGQYRKDIVYLHRSIGEGNKDVYEIRVSRGTAASSMDAAVPNPPEFINNTFLDGSEDIDVVLCVVEFDGINPSPVPQVFEQSLYKLGVGTEIPADSDLNDYNKPGVYRVTTNAAATSIENCPIKWAFTMLVRKNIVDRNLIQEITAYTYADWMADTRPAIKYIRFRVENVWSKWFAIGGVDSIVAEGKTNDWNWIKYENGTAILWTQKTYTTTANDWTANGNVYAYNPPYLPNYPFNVSDGAYSGMGTHLLEYSMFSAQSYGFRPALVSATKYAGTISTFLMIIAKWK